MAELATIGTKADAAPASWWRDAVVYQVYVRSFADGNGDGIGDLPGITQRLHYLRELGVDAIWLTPFYPSPGVDHGYDVSDYVDVDPRFGHDLALPYLMVQHGRRAVYDTEALASEKPSRDIEDEYRRKVRMFEHCWLILVRGGMLRGVGPLYAFELLAHRVLRYASGLLHVVLLATSLALVTSGLVYELVLAAQIALLVLALAGRLRIPVPGAAIAYYYVLVTWATVAALFRYVRFGVPPVWEKVEGTR